MIVVHVTHEAVEKIGGIGAVVAGLVTADAYRQTVSRTLLVGPLFRTDQPANLRIGEGGTLIYSTLDNLMPSPWREKFEPVQHAHNVGIVYGTRKINDPCGGKTVTVEVLLLDVFHQNRGRVNLFKGELYKKFGIPSSLFEHIWDYEQYVRIAEPGYEALQAIGCDGDDQPVIYLSHEYMGMPLALKVMLAGSHNSRTVFYAHEVASVRPIVEHAPGHDTMFYNVLQHESRDGKCIEDVFPSVFENYKHPLVKAARHCDHVFCVGDYVERELKFLDHHFRRRECDLVYNGVQALPLTLEQKHDARTRMQQYAMNLFEDEPDWIFTHVCRPVMSKGIWRDFRVMHHMEPLLAARGETAVYFLLGTLGGQRRSADVRHMEREYDWPVGHEIGYPDLSGGEEGLFAMIDVFNKGHSRIRAVLVNQWDWNRQVCGDRMPADMTFADIRRGSDLEFGLSIYEPYGIAQFEALAFGAICVPSNVCGCMGFARALAARGMDISKNIVEGNFLALPPGVALEDAGTIGQADRDAIESREGKRLADLLVPLLPRDDQTLQARIADGYALAEKMNWEHVVTEFFLPSLTRTVSNDDAETREKNDTETRERGDAEKNVGGRKKFRTGSASCNKTLKS